MTIHELNDASSIIYEEAGEDANVILGCVVDKSLTNEINITVIATGLNDDVYPKFFESDNSKEEYVIQNKTISNDKSSEENIHNNDKNETNNTTDDDMVTFGENLDIPTFLRNRNS